MRRLKILTWHTHGSYLYYLTQLPHDFYVLSKLGRPPGYSGKTGHIPWGSNVFDLPVEQAKDEKFDCIIFQDDMQFIEDQYLFLSASQQKLPRIYIEHDPPCEHPTNTPHPINDSNVLLIHVTPFNALMWDNRSTPTKIIEHGVLIPSHVSYNGELQRGLVIVNHLARRGRRLGFDVYTAISKNIPLDLIGMGAEEAGGIGEIQHANLPKFSARYRFFFNPIRYTSLGLAIIEAMMIGLPIVALATTEMATVIENGKSGYINTDTSILTDHMKNLLADQEHAKRLGEAARRYAMERFNIQRFINDWDGALKFMCGS